MFDEVVTKIAAQQFVVGGAMNVVQNVAMWGSPFNKHYKDCKIAQI